MGDIKLTMHRISVLIPVETRAAIDRISAANKPRAWTHSTIVREALADWIEKIDRQSESLSAP